jgi:cytoskeleton protein RodZ
MADVAGGDAGSRLRAARESSGLSLEQIAKRTKIAASVLDAIERNDVSRLPGGIFARAFVRSYAIEVGLDPDRTVQEFVDRFPRSGVAEGRPRAREREENQAIENDRRAARSVLLLIGLSVPLAIAIMYLSATGWPRPQEAAGPMEAERPSVPASVPLPPPVSAPAVAPAIEETPVKPAPSGDEASPPVVEAASVRVTLSAVRQCWVTATVDGQPAWSRTLTMGESADLAGNREVALKVGDASALTLTINGLPAAPLGATGAVVAIRITPANYRSFLSGR